MDTNKQILKAPGPTVTLIRELALLLSKVIFNSTKGCREGKPPQNWRVLVDVEPSSLTGTFDAGIAVYPLVDEELDLTGIEIAAIGKSDDDPRVRPFRKLLTNKRGCLIFKDLPVGNYRLSLARSVVAPVEAIPFVKKAVHGDFANNDPQPGLFLEYKSEDGNLTYVMRETRDGHVLLYFEAEANYKESSVEYELVHASTNTIVTFERDGTAFEVTGILPLQPDSKGRLRAQVQLDRRLSIPSGCVLRAWITNAKKEAGSNGNYGTSKVPPQGETFSGCSDCSI